MNATEKLNFYRIAVCGKTACTVRRRGTGPLGPVSTLRIFQNEISFIGIVVGGGWFEGADGAGDTDGVAESSFTL